MAINLTKGQTINLNKDEFDLSKVTIGLGWDIKKEKAGGIFGMFGGTKEPDIDLDAVAFLLDANSKVADLGRTITLQGGQKMGLVDSDVIFFNNLKHPEGFIFHTGDNRTGAGDGDDEQIVVHLNQVPSRYQCIKFVVSIYNGAANNQSFGNIENAFIRAVDARGKEMARYNLSNESDLRLMRSMVLGEVYRRDGGWKFRAIGDGHPSDSFVELLKLHLPY